MTPFDYVKSVTETKEYLMVDKAAEKIYVPYLINRSLSFNVETLGYANVINLRNNLDKKLQYDYYFYLFPKRKRFSKWFKRKSDDDVKLIREYYGYNIQKAKQALTILSKGQLETIRKKFEQGGIKT